MAGDIVEGTPIERIRLREAPPNGPQFVLLHGYAANRRQLLHLAEVLAAAGGEAYIVDLPGRGDSDAPASPLPLEGPRPAMPTPNETRAVLAALERLRDERTVKPDRLVLTGHSLGGGVALDVARAEPPAAVVSLGGLERPVRPGQPRNLLLITARLEIPPLREAADRMHARAGRGSARREFFATHSTLPYSSAVQHAIVEWTNRAVPGARLQIPPWFNEKLLALELAAAFFLVALFFPLAGLAGWWLSFEPLGEIVSESRISAWSPAHLGGYALLAGVASISALSLLQWFEGGVPLRFLHLADGDYLASLMLLSSLWLLPALRPLPWVRDTRELRANLLVALLLAAYVIVVAGGFVTWKIFDLWPTTARWLRFLPLLVLLSPFALGEELLRRTFSKHRDHSPLTAFILWRLALLAAVAYGVVLLRTGQEMIVLHSLPVFLLSLVECYFAETLHRALGSPYACAVLKTLLLAWFFAAFFPLR
ncbi:MAG TPA: alpha/beta fold hydrolase [Candidatus Xenobia bacterium]|nr:alpha/beta fold hydrolase [Candidatus Xenobia bacterium]